LLFNNYWYVIFPDIVKKRGIYTKVYIVLNNNL
jgi:hypothetical protein